MELNRYRGQFIEQGELRTLVLEARNLEEARAIGQRWNAAIQSEDDHRLEPLPEGYDAVTARQILGGISQSTLYRLLATRKLRRMPGRKIVVTRESIENFKRIGRN